MDISRRLSARAVAGVGLCFVFISPAAGAQDASIVLEPGTRVRVHVIDETFPADVLRHWPRDSLQVRRTDLHWAPDSIRIRLLHRIEILELAVPSGNQHLRGVLVGSAMSVGAGIVYGAAFCQPSDISCSGQGMIVTVASLLLTLPLGLLVGSFYPKWHPLDEF